MNNVEIIVLESLSDITGLDIESLNSANNINLFKEGILDSLSFVNLIGDIEEKLDIEVDFTKINVNKISNIQSIIDFINDIVL